MDLNTIHEIVGDLGTLGGIVIPTFGIVLGFKGLNTWREQLHGSEEFKLARELLRAVFKVRDEISNGRMITGREMLPEIRGRLLVSLSELSTLQVEARMMWGPAAEDAILLFNATARTYLMSISFPLKNPTPEKVSDEESIVHGTDTDTFGKRLIAEAEVIEKFVTRYMPRKRNRSEVSFYRARARQEWGDRD